MKIAFVWPWNRASEILPNWRDGLRAALEIIAKGHKVDWFLDGKLPILKYDFILVWDDSNTQVPARLGSTARMGLCLTTDPVNIVNLKNFEVIYCESKPIFEDVRKQGLKAILAFGTDTNFFTPDLSVEKDIEYLYPATFSPWKNQEEIAHLGKRLTCVGTIQPDGQKQYERCKLAGVNLKIGYFPAEEIRDLYRRSKCVIIPASHGSERTVLEAKSMGVPIKTTFTTNPKVLSLINEPISNFTAEKYAEALMKGMT